MPNRSDTELQDAIATLEQRMELRRMQMRLDVAAFNDLARERFKPVPLIAAGVFMVGGFLLARSRGGAPRTAAKAALGAAPKMGFLATLIAASRIVMRLANNPWVREQWNMYWRRRASHAP